MSGRPNRPARGGDRDRSERGGSERGGERNRGSSERGGDQASGADQRRGGGGSASGGTPTSEFPAMERAMDRGVERERAEERAVLAGSSSSVGSPTFEVAPPYGGPPVQPSSPDSQIDMDVTVLAFAQWVSEMKSKQHNSNHQMQAEMSIIRNAITSNNTDLGDFKRHSAAIQQQMQSEINEIRESLSSVFMEITGAVRDNAGADQEIKLKIQSLNEQAVRNETAFAQLADAADQSQSKLRNAVQEMQLQSERMREELGVLTRTNENLETSLSDRYNRIAVDIDQVDNDLHVQLDRRKEHLKKMVNDVMTIGDSFHNLVADFGDHKKVTSETQNKLQSNLYIVEQAVAAQARTVTPQRSTNGQPVTLLPTTAASMTLPASVANMRTVPVAAAAPMPGQLAAIRAGTAPMAAQSIVYR